MPASVDAVLQFLDFFLKGNLSLEPHPCKKPHDWLPEQGWQDLMKLTELAANKGAPGTCMLVPKHGLQSSRALTVSSMVFM